MGSIDEWVIGFDCNHGMDNPEIKNAEYTENECKRLIDQIIEEEKHDRENNS